MTRLMRGGVYTITETTKANNTAGPLALTILAGAAPSVLGVTPSIGLTNGGTAVTITGSGFEPGARLFFGGQARFVRLGQQRDANHRRLRPPGPLGVVDVMLTNPDGNTATLHQRLYLHRPAALHQRAARQRVRADWAAMPCSRSPPAYVGSYQWQFNGGNLVDNGRITGSHSSTLTVGAGAKLRCGQLPGRARQHLWFDHQLGGDPDA